MSVNKYNHTSGELTTLANGSRCWIGTKAAYDAEKQAGTLPVNCLIAITDDSEDNNYSTDEKLTGKFWIDGKPIYRKVFSLTSPTTEGYTQILSLTDLHIETMIKLDGMINLGTYQWEPINWGHPSKIPTSIIYYINGNINQWVESTRYGQPEFIILEYTKTTD